jgi:hypothetical protein
MKNSALLKDSLVISTQIYSGDVPPDGYIDCPTWVVSNCSYNGTTWLWIGGRELLPEELAQLKKEEDNRDDNTRLEKQRRVVRDFGTGTRDERIARLENVLTVVVRNLTRE